MGGSKGVDVKDSEDQKAMAQVAKEKWATYTVDFMPVENAWMSDIGGWNNERNYTKAAGVGNTSVNKAYGHAMSQLLTQGGNTGRLNAGINDMAVKQNGARVDTQSRMQVNQQARYIQGLQNVANVGLGKETQAVNSMYDAAALSNSYNQQAAQNDFNETMANRQAIGMGIGAATRWGIG